MNWVLQRNRSKHFNPFPINKRKPILMYESSAQSAGITVGLHRTFDMWALGLVCMASTSGQLNDTLLPAST